MIDTKRLATDAAYWDFESPGTATHYSPDLNLYYKLSDGLWLYWNTSVCSPRWVRCLSGSPLAGELIPRPNKPAAPKWDGEAWPVPIGAKLKNWCGEKRTVVAHDNNNIICRCDEQADSYVSYTKARASENKLEPIRTAEQRQREELANEVSKAMYKVGYAPNLEDPESIAGAILSRYNLEPKP